MTDEPLEIGGLVRENRQLRAALGTLLDELERSSGTSVDVTAVREQMPAAPGERDPIDPPWEREGYDSKAAWLDARKKGSRNTGDRA